MVQQTLADSQQLAHHTAETESKQQHPNQCSALARYQQEQPCGKPQHGSPTPAFCCCCDLDISGVKKRPHSQITFECDDDDNDDSTLFVADFP